MKDNENIEQRLQNLGQSLGPDEDLIQKVMTRIEADQTTKTSPAETKPDTWRIIMKSNILRLAAAAVIVVAVITGLNITGGPDMANVAWGEVTTRLNDVDYVHCYFFKSRGVEFKRHVEMWYSNGRIVSVGDDGATIFYDDWQTRQGFDSEGRLISKGPSFWKSGSTFLECLTGKLLSNMNEQFKQQIPANVGDDFLIYEFDGSADSRGIIESMYITVGRNSLLPIQMKLCHKDGDYDLIILDYQAAEKPEEFFEPPIAASSNCWGEVVLDGDPTTLDVVGVAGLKQAVVRLHGKYQGPADQLPSNYRRMMPLDFRQTYERKAGPIFKLDVHFITDEGYRSATNDIIVLWLNETQKCGVGSAAGGLDNWPDGKYRNIKFSPMIKPTEKAGTYTIEMSCWLLPKGGTD